MFVMGNMGDISKGEAMKPLLKRIGLISLLAVFLLCLVVVSAEAGQKEKFFATKKYGPIISRSIIYPGDMPKHEMVQLVRMDTVIRSSDPDYVGTEQWVFGQLNSIGGSGSHRGTVVDHLKTGDQAWGTFEGTHQTTVRDGGLWEFTGHGTVYWTGGTGKHENAKGTTAYRIKGTPQEVLVDFEGEIEY